MRIHETAGNKKNTEKQSRDCAILEICTRWLYTMNKLKNKSICLCSRVCSHIISNLSCLHLKYTRKSAAVLSSLCSPATEKRGYKSCRPKSIVTDPSNDFECAIRFLVTAKTSQLQNYIMCRFPRGLLQHTLCVSVCVFLCVSLTL